MNVGVEFVAYNESHQLVVAQALREIVSSLASNDTISFNDILSQLNNDSTRDGFGGIITQFRGEPIGLVTWHDITGRELNDRWRPRFAPKDRVPTPDGLGVLIARIGVIPSLRGRGLGARLLATALEKIEPTHDWIAANANTLAHGALGLFQERGFEVLPLTGVQTPEKVCLLKVTHQPVLMR